MKCAGLVQSSSVLFYLQNQICSSSANDFNRQHPGGIPGTVPFKNKLLSACSQPHIENGYLVKSKLAFFLSCHGLCFSNSLCHYGEEDSTHSIWHSHVEHKRWHTGWFSEYKANMLICVTISHQCPGKIVKPTEGNYGGLQV